MSLNWIRSSFRCDECGKSFWILMDPAMEVSAYHSSLFDLAEEGITGSLDGYKNRLPPSIRDLRHLCGTCTKEMDEREAEKVIPFQDR